MEELACRKNPDWDDVETASPLASVPPAARAGDSRVLRRGTDVPTRGPRRLVSSACPPTPLPDASRRPRPIAPRRNSVGSGRCAIDEPSGDECGGETDEGQKFGHG
jgi:hypothetical protein